MTELLQFSLFGLMLGCVYAIAAMGLVLTYTVTGVFNFAHGAVGMLAAFLYYELRVEHGVPTPIAATLVVLLFGPAGGLIAERLLRRFRGTDWATSLVVTIALTVGLLGVATKVFDPGVARHIPNMFGKHRIVVLSVPISFDRLFQVVVAATVTFGLRFLLFGTPTGARMRSVVDDPELARLKGVRSIAIARLSWMIGFALAALGGVLFAGGQNLNAFVLTLLVLNAYGAAMVGRLASLPMTCVGALALGLIQELTNVTWLWPTGDVFLRLRLALPGLFLIAALLFVPSFRLSAGRVVGRDQPRAPTMRGAAIAGAVLIAVVAVFAHVGPANLQPHVATALVIGTIALSIVALTGLSGQVSLTQYLFVGLGAFVAGKTFGGASVLGMLLGGLASAALGVLAALPAVRLRGLHLALCTFGVALVGREVILGDERIFGLEGISVKRPHVLGLSTSSDAAFATWCAVVFVLLALLVVAVRRSWFGQLTAIRDSELAAATIGMQVRMAKLVIFVLSAFIAGCAGSVFGGLAGSVGPFQFEPVSSLLIVLFAYVGGVTSITGAGIAGLLFALLAYAEATFPELSGVAFVGIAAAAISLGRQPNGLAGILLGASSRLAELRDKATPKTAEKMSPAPVTTTLERRPA